MKKEYLKVKFNSGNLAILCSKCSKIIKVGREFTKEELDFTSGKSKKKLPAQYCLQCQLKDKIYNYPTKHPQGFIQSEIDELLKKYPTINMDKFNDATMGNTCMFDETDGLIQYHCDILVALRAGLGDYIHPLEWD